jgi:HK97 family phage major capsid protein
VSMSVSEARSEIQNLFKAAEAIERKYPDGVIDNNEDATEVKRLLTEVDGLETKLAALEEGEQRKARITGGLRQYSTPSERMQHAAPDDDEDDDAGLGSKSLGDFFTNHEEYKRIRQSGVLDSPHSLVSFTIPLGQKAALLDRARFQRKALVYSATGVGGPLIVNDRQAGVIGTEIRERTLLDVVARTTTTSDTIEYVKINSFTNNAASVAEASVTTGTTGTKAESALDLAKATAPVVTIAHWIPVTNKMLADAPAIRGLIDQHLLIGLELELEDEIISGTGSGNDLTGILASGIQSYGAASSNNVLDAILHARTLIRVNGKTRPNAVVMNPLDWEAVRLARENAATGTLGGYLMGPPSQVGDVTLWGMPVIEAEGMTENTVLVGDFRLGGMFFEREGAQIRVGLINDQFVRNMQTILAELRGAWVTFRPNAFCRVTGA